MPREGRAGHKQTGGVQKTWQKTARAVRREALMATAMALATPTPAERLLFWVAARAWLALMVAGGCRKNFLDSCAAVGAYFHLGAVLHILQISSHGAPADASHNNYWLWNIAMGTFFALGFELSGDALFSGNRGILLPRWQSWRSPEAARRRAARRRRRQRQRDGRCGNAPWTTPDRCSFD